jgi:hypothetical protein
LFIQAVQSISDYPKASQLADESLRKSIFLSEKLAIKQAESLFDARREDHGFGRGCLGCRLDPSQIENPEYLEKFLELFGFAAIPINWAKIESNKGEFDFSQVDSCINIISKKRLLIGAGPLLCFSKQYLPKWLYRGGAGFEKIRETAYKFVSKIVARYCDVIHRWYVVSGLNVFNHFGFNFEQVLEMTRAATMAVKAAGSRGLRIIEINNPWGEYYASDADSIPPLVYMDMVVQSGINFDAFGLQMQFGKDQSGMHIRDMMQISAILDSFGPVAKPLYVTNVAIPSQGKDGSYSSDVAGLWHQQWNQSQQAQWLDQFYKIALSKPFVDAVTYSSLTDKQDSIITTSGLLTDQLEPKESFQALKNLQNNIFIR